MRRFLCLLPVAAVLIAACGQPTASPEPLIDPPQPSAEPAGSPPALKTPRVESLCPKSRPFEEGHPQSRWFRGGCLENFEFFVTAGHHVPPDELSGKVTGTHYKLGEQELVVKPVRHEVTPSGERVPLYEILVKAAEREINPCEAEFHPKGRAGASGEQHEPYAIAVPGAWDVDSGAYIEATEDGAKVFTLACRSGAAAKAVSWGYAPWGTYEGTPLRSFFHSAVALTRAQYDWRASTSYTCNGTWIEVLDRLGLQKADPRAPAGLALEAAWSERGLYCMAQPRYPACNEEPAVLEARRCDESMLKDPSRWPKEVLFVTYSRGVSETGTRKCPNGAERCG
ncbi:MAG TPA: ADYC domain-containing protein [Candidatus Nanopelagicales bacterium]|nr:ADYC domain-containing protein [Candidatus Nanopelagicales bacterium]